MGVGCREDNDRLWRDKVYVGLVMEKLGIGVRARLLARLKVCCGEPRDISYREAGIDCGEAGCTVESTEDSL